MVILSRGARHDALNYNDADCGALGKSLPVSPTLHLSLAKRALAIRSSAWELGICCVPVLELPGRSYCQDSAPSVIPVLVGSSAQWSWSLTASLLSNPLHWGLLDVAKRETSAAAKLPSSGDAQKLLLKSSY